MSSATVNICTLPCDFTRALTKTEEIVDKLIHYQKKFCLDIDIKIDQPPINVENTIITVAEDLCCETDDETKLLIKINGGVPIIEIRGGEPSLTIKQADSDFTNSIIKLFVPVILKYQLIVCFSIDNIEFVKQLVSINPNILVCPIDLYKLKYVSEHDNREIRDRLNTARNNKCHHQIKEIFKYQNDKILGLKSAMESLSQLYDVPILNISCVPLDPIHCDHIVFRLLTEWCIFMDTSSMKKFQHTFYTRNERIFMVRNDCFYLYERFGYGVPNFLRYCKKYIIKNNLLCGCDNSVFPALLYDTIRRITSEKKSIRPIPGLLFNINRYGNNICNQLFDAFQLSNHVKIVDDDFNTITENKFFYEQANIDDYFENENIEYPAGYYTKDEWFETLDDLINKFKVLKIKHERTVVFDFPVPSKLIEKIREVFPNCVLTLTY